MGSAGARFSRAHKRWRLLRQRALALQRRPPASWPNTEAPQGVLSRPSVQRPLHHRGRGRANTIEWRLVPFPGREGGALGGHSHTCIETYVNLWLRALWRGRVSRCHRSCKQAFTAIPALKALITLHSAAMSQKSVNLRVFLTKQSNVAWHFGSTAMPALDVDDACDAVRGGSRVRGVARTSGHNSKEAFDL